MADAPRASHEDGAPRMGAMLFAVLSRGGQATLACRNGAMQDHTRPRAATKPEEPFRLPGKFTVG